MNGNLVLGQDMVGVKVLTPLGEGVIAEISAQRDLVRVNLDALLDDGTSAYFEIDDRAFTSPMLRHFPDEDPVAQYDQWASTDAVMELVTIRVQAACGCGCGNCWMTPTAAWVLGQEPAWQGSVHDVTNNCECLTKGMCDCLNEPLPELNAEWFTRVVCGQILPGSQL